MTRNIGLGKYEPYLAWGGKIKPSEVEETKQYVYLKVSANDSAVINACALGSVTSANGTITLGYPDYPRSLLATFTETGGTAWTGTATITGKNQFGESVSEAFSCVNLGTSAVAGTKVFDQITAMSVVVGTYGTGAVDLKVGYAIGTPNAKLGLYTKISKATDVKRVTWVDNATVKPGTVVVDTTHHAIAPTDALNAQDDYVVLVRPNYESDDENATYAGTSASIS
jgi:hypothetical protein